jgi:Coenzyme PQQ synthesis protein D (PqqD)
VASETPAVGDGLEVNETKDGLIVYEPDRDRVHYLNATAAVVFTLCDGTRDAAAIADAVGKAFDLDHSPLADVNDCLSQLRDEGLLQ